jgi:hypothetical protein
MPSQDRRMQIRTEMHAQRILYIQLTVDVITAQLACIHAVFETNIHAERTEMFTEQPSTELA